MRYFISTILIGLTILYLIYTASFKEVVEKIKLQNKGFFTTYYNIGKIPEYFDILVLTLLLTIIIIIWTIVLCLNINGDFIIVIFIVINIGIIIYISTYLTITLLIALVVLILAALIKGAG